MIRSYQLLIVFGTMAVLLLLIGCGPSTTTGTDGLTTRGASPTYQATAVAKSSLRATNVPIRSGDTGPVTLHVDASSYQTSDTISVTLSNQSSQTVYFPDHLTNCTVILLQRQKVQPVQPLESENGQAGVNPCRLAVATRMHSLGAGQSLVVKLVAPFSGWLPGLYLTTLSYRTSLTAGSPTTIYSAVFQVGPTVPPEP